MRKKILMLGASPFQIAAIEYARRAGHHVITCDNLPDNPGHQHGHEYFNVSTTDMEGVLYVAKTNQIDGIIAYASDPSAPTAAFVAERLGLPGNPYAAVSILANKDRYRGFLRANAFNSPRFNSFTEAHAAQHYFDSLGGKAVIKPVDASGSKGVSILNPGMDLTRGFTDAMHFSRAGRVLVEEFVNRKGHQIAGDAFVQEGMLKFCGLGQEHFDAHCNPMVPIGESFPLQIEAALRSKIESELQRLIDLLGINVGVLNLDIMVNDKNDVYLMEVGPRNGGNFISEAIHHCHGVDLIKASVDSALGIPVAEFHTRPKSRFISSYIVHSARNGILKKVLIPSEIEARVLHQSMFVPCGQAVQRFDRSNAAIGALILEFDSHERMVAAMDHPWCQVDVVDMQLDMPVLLS
jgi:biotin carboxylase